MFFTIKNEVREIKRVFYDLAQGSSANDDI